ncbi:MAG: hypothetical protein LM564_05820, partial [Desulfurococcaceae archaeon]|nr:hypothetical protein [Desulfurococcaceae archaeon]
TLAEVWQEFTRSLDNDLNTPKALAVLHRLLSVINAEVVNLESSSLAFKALTTLELMDRVLGILPRREEILRSYEELEELIKLIVEIRSRLRHKRMYEESDWIRAELSKLGIRLADTKEETKWYFERYLRSAKSS